MNLHTHNLNYHIGTKKILSDISFRSKPSELTVILGQNGTGKSSLLKSLCGLIPTLLNQVYWDNRSLNKIKLEEKSKILGWLPTESSLNFPYSVFEVCLMGCYPWHKGMIKKEDKLKALKSLELFNLEKKSHGSFLSLSSGEKKLVELARILSSDHKILLLDEPTAHLDLKNSFKVFQTLKKKSGEGKTILLATHDIELAYRYGHRIILMKEGKILANTKATHKNIIPLLEETFEINLTLLSAKDSKSKFLGFSPKENLLKEIPDHDTQGILS